MKKLLALLLAMLMILTLFAACGDETAQRDDEDTEQTAETEEEEVDYYEEGMIHKQAREYDEAIEDFNAAIEGDEEDTRSYLELADVYIRLQEFQKAYDILTEGYDQTNSSGIKDKLLDFNNANVIKDSDGVLQGKSHFSDGKMQWCHCYSYKDDVFSGITRLNEAGEQTHAVELEYNDAGKPTTSYAYYTNTGILEKVTFSYNNDGQLILTNEYNEQGKFVGHSINSFDENGYKIGEIRYDENANVHWELRYTHDVVNRKSVCDYYFYGVKVGTCEATYSESGYVNGSSSRFQGSYDREISYDVSYSGGHEREEYFEGEESYARIICYNASLEDLY